ncbi:circadian locomoter output cycles protein kaput-like [Babylonia areolata]|uniref:circadian locomoter output cycles protein kaput-like n=1 Tax=Babylonia areolata TaxID=304850 RepID=UPI003FD50524
MNYGKRIALFRPPSSRSIESESVLSIDDLDDGDEKDNVKRKTRNLSEKKRRDQFNLLINELCSMVASNNKKMDKSTVLKSAIQFLKTHQEISVQSAANEIKEDWKPTFLCNEEFAQLMLEAVDSFLIVFTQRGSVLYVSESVTSLLGHLPTDLINRSLYDFVHEDDHVKLYNVLSTYHMQSSSLGLDFEKPENQLSLTCHLRRGTIDPKDQSTYELVHISGSSRLLSSDDDMLLEDQSNDHLGLQSLSMSVCFCCTVRLHTSHIIREMSNVDEATCEFTSRHSLEWKFLFLDHRAPPIIGYLPFEVLGTSGYDYYHPEDIERVSKCHEQLMQMGEGTSCYYRFLTKGQQWIWLRTRYYITYHQWNSKPEFIVCTNTVVRFADVRSQLRKELGYSEEDSFSSLVAEPSKTEKSLRSPSLCSVSSGGQSRTRTVSSPSKRHRSLSKSPDCVSSVSGQASDVDSSQQHPHSTEKEPNHTRKYVTSQLQSLLQQHLQRNTALRSMQQQQQQQQQQRLAPATVTPGSSNVTSSTSVPQLMPSIVPIMAMPPNMIHMPQPQLMDQGVSVPNNVPSSPDVNPAQPVMVQSSVFLTPAQQLLHDQLLQKSEQLQDTIRRQQEELRQITQQLAQARGPPQQQQQQQPSPADILPMQNAVPPNSTTPLLVAPSEPITAALSVMRSGGGNHIMLSQLHMEAASFRSASGPHQPGPFHIISPESDLGFCNNDLSDSC